MAILMVLSISTPLQVLLFIKGNKMISQFVKNSESRLHSSLFKGSPVKTVKHAGCVVVSSCYPSCRSPLHHLHTCDISLSGRIYTNFRYLSRWSPDKLCLAICQKVHFYVLYVRKKYTGVV